MLNDLPKGYALNDSGNVVNLATNRVLKWCYHENCADVYVDIGRNKYSAEGVGAYQYSDFLIWFFKTHPDLQGYRKSKKDNRYEGAITMYNYKGEIQRYKQFRSRWERKKIMQELNYEIVNLQGYYFELQFD